MITRYFENTTGSHRKFWEVTYPDSGDTGNTWTVRWGRIGSSGQNLQHTEKCRYDASYAAALLIAQKLAKGYVEMSASYTTKPALKTKPVPLQVAPLPLKNSPKKISDPQRTAILALLDAGHPAEIVAATLNITRQQVAAVAAHKTMGTYEPALVGDSTGQAGRAFDWGA
jgi:predicted DNA-binding WGR domain protein